MNWEAYTVCGSISVGSSQVIDAKTPRKPYTQLQVVNQIREQLGLDFVENVDNHDFEAAASLGSSLAERTKIQLESAANTYKQSATANKKQELAKKIADTVDRQLNHVTKTLELFPVGQTVRVVTSGKNIFYGTVTKVWSPDGQNGDNKLNNPTAPSSWKMQVLLADTARELTVPLSKVNRLTQQSISITPAESDFFGVNVYELFDQRQTSSREKRQVFTGNILRAYGMFNGKGQVVNFTDNKGRVRQGILMPKGFEIEKTLAAQPVQMPTPEDALRFLTTETQRTGVVKTLDEALSIRAYYYTNEFILTTLATKKAGGKYYLDEKILAAAGAEFHSVGGNMRCIVPSDRIMPVLQTIMQEKGYALAAFDGRETARKMLGIELPTLETFVEAEEASVKEVETEILSKEDTVLTAKDSSGIDLPVQVGADAYEYKGHSIKIYICNRGKENEFWEALVDEEYSICGELDEDIAIVLKEEMDKPEFENELAKMLQDTPAKPDFFEEKLYESLEINSTPDKLETSVDFPSVNATPDKLETSVNFPSVDATPDKLETSVELPLVNSTPDKLETPVDFPSVNATPDKLETSVELPLVNSTGDKLETPVDSPTVDPAVELPDEVRQVLDDATSVDTRAALEGLPAPTTFGAELFNPSQAAVLAQIFENHQNYRKVEAERHNLEKELTGAIAKMHKEWISNKSASTVAKELIGYVEEAHNNYDAEQNKDNVLYNTPLGDFVLNSPVFNESSNQIPKSVEVEQDSLLHLLPQEERAQLLNELLKIKFLTRSVKQLHAINPEYALVAFNNAARDKIVMRYLETKQDDYLELVNNDQQCQELISALYQEYLSKLNLASPHSVQNYLSATTVPEESQRTTNDSQPSFNAQHEVTQPVAIAPQNVQNEVTQPAAIANPNAQHEVTQPTAIARPNTQHEVAQPLAIAPQNVQYEVGQPVAIARPNAQNEVTQPLAIANPNAQNEITQPVAIANPNAQHEVTQPVAIANPNSHNETCAKRVARLLHQAGLADQIVQDEDFYLTVQNDPYIPLVIERHGDELYLTHYLEDNYGDKFIDSEMIYRISKDGLLHLREVATMNPFTGGESRSSDRGFAATFAQNLLHQGFDVAAARAGQQKQSLESASPNPAKASLGSPTGAWDEQVLRQDAQEERMPKDVRKDAQSQPSGAKEPEVAKLAEPDLAPSQSLAPKLAVAKNWSELANAVSFDQLSQLQTQQTERLATLLAQHLKTEVISRQDLEALSELPYELKKQAYRQLTKEEQQRIASIKKSSEVSQTLGVDVEKWENCCKAMGKEASVQKLQPWIDAIKTNPKEEVPITITAVALEIESDIKEFNKRVQVGRQLVNEALRIVEKKGQQVGGERIYRQCERSRFTLRQSGDNNRLVIEDTKTGQNITFDLKKGMPTGKLKDYSEYLSTFEQHRRQIEDQSRSKSKDGFGDITPNL